MRAATPATGRTRKSPTSSTIANTVLDPMTSYQITSMLQGVIQRGTAAGKVDLGRRAMWPARPARPTTRRTPGSWASRRISSPVSISASIHLLDAWPRRHGWRPLSAPIFNEFMQAAVKDMPASKFVIPAGHEPHCRSTARPAWRPAKAIRTRSSKPSSRAPVRPTASRSSVWTTPWRPEEILKTSPQANQAVQSGAGGLY